MDNAMKGSRHNCFNLHSGSFCLFWSQQNLVTIVVMVMGVFAGPLLAGTDGAAESLRERVEYLVTVPTDATPERFVDSVTGVR